MKVSEVIAAISFLAVIILIIVAFVMGLNKEPDMDTSHYKFYPCSHCHGSGELRNGAECAWCNGTGFSAVKKAEYGG